LIYLLISLYLSHQRVHSFTFLIPLHHIPCSTLFPYTTLFRSKPLLSQQVVLHLALGLILADPFAFLLILMGQSALNQVNFKFLRSEEHTSELQSRFDLVCRLLLEKKKLVKWPSENILTYFTQL